MLNFGPLIRTWMPLTCLAVLGDADRQRRLASDEELIRGHPAHRDAETTGGDVPARDGRSPSPGCCPCSSPAGCRPP